MPIYQYKCAKCGNFEEKFQKIGDQPLKKCKACGGKLEKVISPIGIIFKGGGFHVTDYSRGKSGGDVEASDKKKDAIKKEDKTKKEKENKDKKGKKED
ncbi:MAG: FmdB family zinc ribbon protein [Armatimonadota bacterium]